MSRSNWVIMALMVSWLATNWATARARCSAAAASRCRSARSRDDPLLVADGVEDLGLDPLVERLADALGNVGRGADDVLGQAEVVQGGLGLPRGDLAAGRLEPLLDVAGELLAGDVVFLLALLERGPVRGGAPAAGRTRREGRGDREPDRLPAAGAGAGSPAGRSRRLDRRRRRGRPAAGPAQAPGTPPA